ncbi:MAG: ATP-binding protein [Kiritimatiellae bacterium]|nr:ATP-binding protein [Kiritimatiellia bacterium]MBP5319645.1 ATP-binding protein [Kiritimatiellia bacterium]
MTSEKIASLIKTSDRLVSEVPLSHRRYLAGEIDWRNRLICIKGARGTGKTTLLLQHVRETFGVGSSKALYFSMDDLWFANHDVHELITHLYDYDYSHVFIDEIHHYGDKWQLLVKNLYDQFPRLNIVYSGSALLKLEDGKGDLSRRLVTYEMRGLSFREFLQFEGAGTFDPLSLEEILIDHRRIAAKICTSIKVLPLFERYRESGYYPFYLEPGSGYGQRVKEIVNKVLEVDYPAVEHVSQETIRKAKKMLMVIAESVPQQPNMKRLYAELETDRNQGLKMLSALDRAGLLSLVPPRGETLKNLSRPEKIYCDNTNLMYALVQRVEIGTVRETLFCNQVGKDHVVTYSGTGDFLVDGRHHFEVGGAGKGYSQIANVPDSYVVNDDTTIGVGKKIPLWLFGFLY